MKDSGSLRHHLIRLGEEFDQDSITFSELGPKGKYSIISTNKCPDGYPGNGKVGVVLKLGKPLFSASGEFHSCVGGRPFVFESALSENIQTFDSLSISSKHTVSLLELEEINTVCEITL